MEKRQWDCNIHDTEACGQKSVRKMTAMEHRMINFSYYQYYNWVLARTITFLSTRGSRVCVWGGFHSPKMSPTHDLG